MRRRPIAFTVAALPAVASLALAACGASATTAQAPGAGPSGMPQAAPDMSAVVSDALDALVDDGTITGTQKDAVVAAFGDRRSPGGPPQASPPPPGQEPATKEQAPGGGDMVANILDPLVEDGTMTEAQSEAIAQVVEDALPDMPGARSPPSDATQA